MISGHFEAIEGASTQKEGGVKSDFRGFLRYGSVEEIVGQTSEQKINRGVLVIESSRDKNYCFAQDITGRKGGVRGIGEWGIVYDEGVAQRLSSRLSLSQNMENYSLDENFIPKLDKIDSLHSHVAHTYNSKISALVSELVSSARAGQRSA